MYKKLVKKMRNSSIHIPGTVVKVVNSQAATSEQTPARFDKSVDFPTDGKPTKPIRASPVLATSNPGNKKIYNSFMNKNKSIGIRNQKQIFHNPVPYILLCIFLSGDKIIFLIFI